MITHIGILEQSCTSSTRIQSRALDPRSLTAALTSRNPRTSDINLSEARPDTSPREGSDKAFSTSDYINAIDQKVYDNNYPPLKIYASPWQMTTRRGTLLLFLLQANDQRRCRPEPRDPSYPRAVYWCPSSFCTYRRCKRTKGVADSVAAAPI